LPAAGVGSALAVSAGALVSADLVPAGVSGGLLTALQSNQPYMHHACAQGLSSLEKVCAVSCCDNLGAGLGLFSYSLCAAQTEALTSNSRVAGPGTSHSACSPARRAPLTCMFLAHRRQLGGCGQQAHGSDLC
jgi:hypothetical protein